MIMPVTPHRIRLVVPKIKSGKVLKTCVRCRQHKTKCDAAVTNPAPCSHCAKKSITCTLDIITNLKKRDGFDVVEKLTHEVSDLSSTLDALIERRSAMISALMKSSQGILKTSGIRTKAVHTPPVSQIQSCLDSPVSVDEPKVSPLSAFDSDFTIVTAGIAPFSMSTEQAYELFTNYEVNFNQFLPIFPDDFFSTINLSQFKQENELLFWSIVLTSYLNYPDVHSSSNYRLLVDHVKALVVKTCWYETPRSVYVISSLLILTTWSLPHTTQLTNNISLKFLSLMKNLSLQFGLHKLEFLNEFSHKTKMNISNEKSIDSVIRERIYKFININSNYWYIYLGLSSNNAPNGSDQDYIINKSSNIDIFDKSINTNDHYINSLLKVSVIQTKLSVNMMELIGNVNESILTLPNQITTSKVLNLKMFNVILEDLKKVLTHENQVITRLIEISITYSKLQLYIYSLSHLNVDINEYKQFISKICSCCFNLLSSYQNQFKDISSFNQLPIHYKFPIELASFILLKIYKSPVLNTVQDYQLIKQKFNEFYMGIVRKGDTDEKWDFVNEKFMKILNKFDSIENSFVIDKMIVDNKEVEEDAPKFLLVKKMKNYLVSSMSYELVWCIYERQKSKDKEKVDWEIFGLDKVKDQAVIDFLSKNESIFN